MSPPLPTRCRIGMRPLLRQHMRQYHQISSQALEYLRGFSQGLAENAEAYRLAEAQNSTTFD
ncbi:PE family protein [Mycobacterium tuberculosis]|nr:PE family protein [Mycobacterium tuberculosis]RER56914.1 PE family protein [Mycobacterium tuberculosis]RES41298.1 PE family protein [Mycobacterium tuberculosis]REX57113.1 PE family protein [Mycobacterium tuberculosis]